MAKKSKRAETAAIKLVQKVDRRLRTQIGRAVDAAIVLSAQEREAIIENVLAAVLSSDEIEPGGIPSTRSVREELESIAEIPQCEAVRDADSLTTQARAILRVVIDSLPPDPSASFPALTANCLEAVSTLLVRVHQSLDQLEQTHEA